MKKITKIIISILAFLVLAAGIIAGTYLVQKNQDIREKAAPSTSLSFYPAVATKSPSQTFNFVINADTGSNKITGIDIEVSYDPSAIQLTQMAATGSISPLSSIIKNGVIDNTAGKARFVAYTAVKTDAITGNLDILNINGSVTSNASVGQYPISFTATTTVSAVDEGQNVIINSQPAIVTVTTASGGGATATAMPTSSATATAKPTATATTAGIGGAQIVLPTATSTVKATATATPKATSTSTPTSSSAATATSSATLPPVPVTGVSLPFVGGVVVGLGAIMMSIFLVF